jgi:hypothetical protein
VKERTDIEYGKRPNPEQEKRINNSKEYCTTLPDGTLVFYVDIKLIRDIDYGDFVEGGNEMAYPNFVPIGEIWIDKVFKINKQRTEQIIVHEAIERKDMQNDPNRLYFKETARTRLNKTGEEGAHVDANRLEKQFRDGKISFKDAIKKYYGENK